MKSKRIKEIAHLVPISEQVWDLCCDHGLIGLEVFEKQKCCIHLLDQVPSIMNKLKIKIKHPNISLLCENAKNYKFPSGEKQSYIIAGIGAFTALDIIENIYKSNKDEHYLICSVHSNIAEFRKRLIHYKPIKEKLIEDSGKIYELCLLRSSQNSKLDEIIFPQETQIQTVYEYYNQLRNFYATKVKFNKEKLESERMLSKIKETQLKWQKAND